MNDNVANCVKKLDDTQKYLTLSTTIPTIINVVRLFVSLFLFIFLYRTRKIRNFLDLEKHQNEKEKNDQQENLLTAETNKKKRKEMEKKTNKPTIYRYNCEIV